MAMVANNPMITTTMSSSIRVKPFRDIAANPPGAKRRRAVSPWLGATYSARRSLFLQEPCLPLRIDPIHSHADTYDQWDPQLGGSLHMAFYQLCGGFRLPVRDLNYKLVMDLQDHAGCEPLLFQGAGDADHRDFDQVGRRSLKGGVGGRTFPERADVVVTILQLRDVAPPSKQCLDIPLLARLGHGAIEPGPDTGEAGEVLLDEPLRVILGDAELAGQGERPLAIDRSEVDRLGARAHFRRDLIVRHAEDDRRRLAVNVPALLEGCDERRVARQMGQESQLDLAIVGRDEHRSGSGVESPGSRLPAR